MSEGVLDRWFPKVRVREGGYYLTICGDVVGPAVRKDDPTDLGRVWTICGCSYHSNGTAFGKSDGWALELVEEVPENLRNAMVPRREHENKLRIANKRIAELEAALFAFKGLGAAIAVAATVPAPLPQEPEE